MALLSQMRIHLATIICPKSASVAEQVKLALADCDAQDAFQRLNGADATVAPDPHDAAFIRFKAMMDDGFIYLENGEIHFKLPAHRPVVDRAEAAPMLDPTDRRRFRFKARAKQPKSGLIKRLLDSLFAKGSA